jgi:drug/metabolite transporter (DMT)-like permease
MRAADWLLLVFLSTLWGATYFFIAVALPEIPPFTLALLRVAIAALALVPLVFAFGYRMPATRDAWRPFIVLAAINNVIPFTLMIYGQTRIAGSLAAVLNATTPLFSLVVFRLFAGVALTRAKLAGVTLGIAGVAVLVGPAALTSNASSVVGMLCVLGASLSYAVSALWMRRLRDIPPLLSSGAQLTCASVMLLPIAAVADRFWTLPVPGVPAIAAVLGFALLSTALAYIVFFRVNATAGPDNVMLVTLLIPVTATVLGVLILGEVLTPNQVAGAFIIALALVLIDGRLLERRGRRGGQFITSPRGKPQMRSGLP